MGVGEGIPLIVREDFLEERDPMLCPEAYQEAWHALSILLCAQEQS